ncbi:peptide deformylase [uncultured Defluviicoccus sp.]|uniref:Peptide deformylase n=1 Tax=metagenome TaxID=256318 RepID=A0A380THX9_9ZZZZ|nr:peptide deformylase [uncultured Defluviicoccus sp.]
MTDLSIIIAPDPRLKRSAQPVGQVDRRVRRLMDDMLDSMHRANGIGLAAPQVGVLQRVIVVDISPPQSPPDPVCMADPEIIWESEEAVVGEEGCLSLPEFYADVTRPKSVCVRYLDRAGARRELTAEGLLAKCVQHEIDHLDGILFVDHLSSLKRNIILRKLAKSKKLAPV